VLYRRESALWVVGWDGRGNRRLPPPPGRAGQALWSPDGSRVLYLNLSQDPAELNSIREADPEGGSDLLVARTSQYVAFDANADASVFAGASGSLAGPYVSLLLRLTQSELPLCEHRAGDPRRVAPAFSPDSQRLYFHSDLHGKPAIYSLAVERLVERTE
jgi:oligogalacturonide lyase